MGDFICEEKGGSIFNISRDYLSIMGKIEQKTNRKKAGYRNRTDDHRITNAML